MERTYANPVQVIQKDKRGSQPQLNLLKVKPTIKFTYSKLNYEW